MGYHNCYKSKILKHLKLQNFCKKQSTISTIFLSIEFYERIFQKKFENKNPNSYFISDKGMTLPSNLKISKKQIKDYCKFLKNYLYKL